MFSAAEAGQQKMAQMDAVLKSTGGAAGMTKDQLLDLATAQSKVTTFIFHGLIWDTFVLILISHANYSIQGI